jgi:mRNA interferase RelE/StbE
MASYRIEFAASAEKDLRRLDQALIANILRRVGALEDDPVPRQSQKLRGTERTYRLRVGDYRIVYELDLDARTIVVYYIRHRREAYRRLQGG